MKIAILTSGILPVPAVQGGAVENLIDFYLEYNDNHHLHDITIYSIWHPDVQKRPALQSEVNHYKYIKVDGRWTKFKKYIYAKTHYNEYYNYQIEYFFEEAYKDLKTRLFDCVISENRPGYAYKLSKRGINNLILHLHNDHLHQGSKYDKLLFDSYKKIITVSNFIKQRVQTIEADDKVQTVYNGIDNKIFSNQHSAQCFNRKDVGLSEEDFVIVFSGRINKDKGISELIDAMQKLKDYQRIKLLILGTTFYGNTTHENAFIQSLRKKADGLSERILFTGFIPYPVIAHYLQLADIAVLPSVWDEPFGLTIAEVQSVGLPIITTSRGGIPEIVTERNALILDIDEHFIDNLATSILNLYQHPEKREHMSDASLERSKLFDKDTYAKNFIAALS